MLMRVGMECQRFCFLAYSTQPPTTRILSRNEERRNEYAETHKAHDPSFMKMPALVKLTESTSRYAIVKTCWINRSRLHGTPACIYLRYWNLDVPDNGVLVCDYWSRKIDKVVVPVTKDTIREDNERLKKQRDNVNGSVDMNLEPKR